jgi:hypothetical protein
VATAAEGAEGLQIRTAPPWIRRVGERGWTWESGERGHRWCGAEVTKGSVCADLTCSVSLDLIILSGPCPSSSDALHQNALLPRLFLSVTRLYRY